MKKKLMLHAFSLMEMMIVLLIVAIIAAASAPMIAKKMMRQTGTGDSPWVFTGTGNSVAFNMSGANGNPVIIGANDPGVNGGVNAPLYIRTNPQFNLFDLRNNGATVNSGQAISFADNNNNVVGHLGMMAQTAFFSNIIPAEPGGGNDGAVIFGHIRNLRRLEGDGRSNYMANKIMVGYNNDINIDDAQDRSQDIIIGSELRNITLQSDANNNDPHEANILIGRFIHGQNNNANSTVTKTIAIGNNLALGNQFQCVVVGDSAQASADNGIAIGHSASVNANNAIAIGLNARASNTAADAVAIGQSAISAGSESVAVGANSQANDTCAISIGANASVQNNSTSSIAIGFRANATNGARSIAIGGGNIANRSTLVNGARSIAIGGSDLDGANGNRTFTLGDNSVAIGYGAQVGSFQADGVNVARSDDNSVAIGNNARTSDDNQIMLGSANANGSGTPHTVVIPGNLRVDGSITYHDNSGNKYTFNNVNAGYIIVSDIRLKNVGEKLTSGLEDIKKLEFFNYTFKDDKDQKPHVGVMAQDLQKVFPISVTEGSDGYLRIRWDEMFYAALNAIKELDNKITEIKTKVASYFDRVAKLEAQIDEQQKTIEELQKQNAEFKKRLAKIEKKGVGVKGVNNKIKTPALKSESEAE